MFRVIVISSTKFIGESFEEHIEFTRTASPYAYFANVSRAMDDIENVHDFADQYILNGACVLICKDKDYQLEKISMYGTPTDYICKLSKK